jgi:uncharacterized protein
MTSGTTDRSPQGGRRGRRSTIAVGSAVAVALLSVLAYGVPSVLVAQRLTVPERDAIGSTPADLGLIAEDVAFPAREEDVTLRGWWIPGTGPQAVILVHGRNSSRANGDLLRLAADLHRLGYHVLLFDLRGHGESGEAPFGLGALEWQDVLGAVDFSLGRGVPAGRVAIVGFSTGAAAGLAAAVREPAIGAVVADGVWPSLRELLDREVPHNSDLPAFYNPGIYLAARAIYGIDVNDSEPADDVAALARSGRPVLLVHEARDRYTNADAARRLDEAAGGAPSVQTWWVEGAEHVKAYAHDPAAYLARLTPFLTGSIGSP